MKKEKEIVTIKCSSCHQKSVIEMELITPALEILSFLASSD